MVAGSVTAAGTMADRARPLPVVVLALLVLAAGCVGPHRQEGPPPVQGPSSPPIEEPPEGPEDLQGPEAQAEDQGLLETLHEDVTTRARSTAAWVDAFLSDERSLAEENRTWVRLRLDAFSEEREGVDFGANASARLVLPRTEDRFQLVFSGDGSGDLEDEALLDEDALPLLEEEEASVATLGLQYLLRETRRNNIRTELGLRFDGLRPYPYAGARWRYLTSLVTWTLRATERLRWYRDTGWESKSTLDLERPLGERLFLRSSARLNWYEEEDGVSYSTAVRLYQGLGESDLLTYEWSNSFETEPEERLKQITLRLRWSRRFLRDWMLLEIAPQVAYREEVDYEPALGLLLRLELSFGDEPELTLPGS